MTQAFLSEPTIALAHKKYLESWSTPAVQKAWNGRKPTLEKFIERFRDSYHARQMFLKANRDSHTAVLEARRMDDIQALAEEVHDRIGATLDTLTPPRFAELDEQPAEPPKEDDEVAQAHAAVEEQKSEVKEKNKNKLPTSRQIYFFMHRAIESGFTYALVPLTRQGAADLRGRIANGETYSKAIIEQRKDAKD